MIVEDKVIKYYNNNNNNNNNTELWFIFLI
jgi:hypothetical protein